MTHCNQIRRFSKAVFNFLTEVFDSGLSFSELGLTDHLVLDIVRHSNLTGLQDVEIYKVGWNIESVYGNDLDLFIQNSSGLYDYYALQAKVLSSNGAYKDLKEKPIQVNNQQWDKLLDHETTFGSKSYYLLYNGKYDNTNFTLTRKDCIGIPTIDELGLGIVETKTIKSIRSTMTPYSNLYFNHLCPDHMDSIRKLFCCPSNLSKSKKQFDRKEIVTDGYQRIYRNEKTQDDQIETKLQEGFAPIRMIIKNQ